MRPRVEVRVLAGRLAPEPLSRGHATSTKGPNAPGAWARWHVHVPAQRPGAYELWARATDKDGRAQPPTTPFNENGYLFGAVVRHPVVVR